MKKKLIRLTYRRERTAFKRKKETGTNIPLSLKYNRTLPKVKIIVIKHWHFLHIKSTLAEIFQNPPILAFREKQKPQRHYWYQIN